MESLKRSKVMIKAAGVLALACIIEGFAGVAMGRGFRNELGAAAEALALFSGSIGAGFSLLRHCDLNALIKRST